FHGETQPGVGARDISQFAVSRLGEDGAVYKAVEYAGPYIERLSVEDRLLFPLMSIDVGAKCGFVNPDEKTLAFAQAASGHPGFEILSNDPGTAYSEVVDIDVSKLEPQVACPPTVANVKPVGEVAGIEIQVAEVGGSTGGRLCDLRALAGRLKNRQ